MFILPEEYKVKIIQVMKEYFLDKTHVFRPSSKVQLSIIMGLLGICGISDKYIICEYDNCKNTGGLCFRFDYGDILFDDSNYYSNEGYDIFCPIIPSEIVFRLRSGRLVYFDGENLTDKNSHKKICEICDYSDVRQWQTLVTHNNIKSLDIIEIEYVE